MIYATSDGATASYPAAQYDAPKHGLRALWQGWQNIQAQSQARGSLAKLSARHLRDIGLTPQDVIQIKHSALPLGSAPDARFAALRRSANW